MKNKVLNYLLANGTGEHSFETLSESLNIEGKEYTDMQKVLGIKDDTDILKYYSLNNLKKNLLS